MSGSPQKQSEELSQSRLQVEAAFASGVTQLFEPIAAQHTEAVLTVQQNQAELSQTLDALKKKLEESLQYSQLPQVGSYLQKLAEIKKRVAVMTSKLNMTSERLVRTHRFAETQHGVLRSHNDTQQGTVNDWLTSTEEKISQLPAVEVPSAEPTPQTASSTTPTPAPTPSTTHQDPTPEADTAEPAAETTETAQPTETTDTPNEEGTTGDAEKQEDAEEKGAEEKEADKEEPAEAEGAAEGAETSVA